MTIGYIIAAIVWVVAAYLIGRSNGRAAGYKAGAAAVNAQVWREWRKVKANLDDARV